MEKRASFVFYSSIYDALQRMEDVSVKAEVYDTICYYAIYGKEPEGMSCTAGAMLELVKPGIDANAKKYENGRKGGRPKTAEYENQPETKTNQTVTKQNQDAKTENQTVTKQNQTAKTENQTVTKQNQTAKTENQTEPYVYVYEYENVNENNNIYIPENGETDSPPSKPKTSEQVADVVSYLNEKTGRNYRANAASTKRLIQARLNEGYTLEDFKTVIDKKCAEWLSKKDMEQYLRPETLFGNKFDGYLNQGEGRAGYKNNYLQILDEMQEETP